MSERGTSSPPPAIRFDYVRFGHLPSNLEHTAQKILTPFFPPLNPSIVHTVIISVIPSRVMSRLHNTSTAALDTVGVPSTTTTTTRRVPAAAGVDGIVGEVVVVPGLAVLLAAVGRCPGGEAGVGAARVGDARLLRAVAVAHVSRRRVHRQGVGVRVVVLPSAPAAPAEEAAEEAPACAGGGGTTGGTTGGPALVAVAGAVVVGWARAEALLLAAVAD